MTNVTRNEKKTKIVQILRQNQQIIFFNQNKNFYDKKNYNCYNFFCN